MAEIRINCEHNAYQELPDVIFHKGVLYGKCSWQWIMYGKPWDGKRPPLPLPGFATYSSNVDDMACYVRDEWLGIPCPPYRKKKILIEQRPSGGGVFA